METKVTNQLVTDLSGVIGELKEAAAPEIMDIEQAANYTRFSKHTIYSKVCRKQIPFRKKGGRLIFLKKELLDWLIN